MGNCLQYYTAIGNYGLLAKLQTKGKTTGLSEAERYELLALLQIYQLGQLRKSEALAEAVKRGLQEPLSR